MRTRAQVRRAQSVCQPEEHTRRLSVATISTLIRQNTRRKSFSSSQRPLCNESAPSSSVTGEDNTTRLAVPARVHSTPELLIAPIRTESGSNGWSDHIERSSSEPVGLLRRPSRFEAMHWKYARFAFLCCFVLLISWVPISIMRVYNNFINPEHPIVALYYAAAVCIPLQGVGNFVVYLTNNWPECRDWILHLVPKHGSRRDRSAPSSVST